jgi:hypothetical protein
MVISDALPVQFWYIGYDTYNEDARFGQNQFCWCQPFECDDEIVIQFQHYTGLSMFLLIYDEDEVLLETKSVSEIATGLYQVTFIPSENTPDFCDQKIVLKIRQDASVILARSDCLDIKASHTGTLLIEYSNHRNFAGLINQQTSPDTTFQLRLPAVFNEERFPETDEVLPLSNNRIISLNSQVKKQRLLETDQMPNYMQLKMIQVLKHQFITIDGFDYVKEEPYEQLSNKFKQWPMRAYSCWLTEKEYVLRNIL